MSEFWHGFTLGIITVLVAILFPIILILIVREAEEKETEKKRGKK